LLLLIPGASAQWLNYKQPGAPRLADGSVNLSAPAPRVNGHPDLSGVWQIEPTPTEELTRLFGDYSPFDVPGDHSSDFHKYLFDVLVDHKDKPIHPEGEALFQARLKTDGRDVSTNRCLPAGIPQMHLLPFPVKFVHSPGLTLLLTEADATIRQIYTDGRKL